MNKESPGNTKADKELYLNMRHETGPDALARLKADLADWQNPEFYKGFTQEQRDMRIAGLKTLIASIEK